MAESGQRADLSQAIILGGYAAHLLMALALTAVLGRYLSAADFGFFAIVAACFGFARDATDLGSTVAAARDIRRDPSRLRLLIEGLIAWRSLMALVLALAVLTLANSQADGQRLTVLTLAAIALLGFGPTAFHALFLARQTQLAVTLLSLVCQGLLFAGCVVLVHAGQAGVGPAVLLVGREALGLLGLAWLGRRALGYWPEVRTHWPALRGFAGSAGLWALAALCRHLLGQVDLLSVYALRGEAEVGALSAAYRPLSPAFLLPWLVTAPLVPIMAVAAERDPARGLALMAHAMTLALGLGALAACAAWVLADDLVALFYGGRYTSPQSDAAAAMRWLALAIVPTQLIAVASVALLVTAREKVALIAVALALLVKIVANGLLVPVHGFLVAPQTTLLVESLLALVLSLIVFWPGAQRRPLGAALARALPKWAAALLPALLLWVLHRALGLMQLPELPPWSHLATILLATALGAWALLASALGRGYMQALRAATALEPVAVRHIPEVGVRIDPGLK